MKEVYSKSVGVRLNQNLEIYVREVLNFMQDVILNPFSSEDLVIMLTIKNP